MRIPHEPSPLYFCCTGAVFFDDHLRVVGLGLLDEDLEALDVLLVVLDREADADALFLGELRLLVGVFAALEARLDLI